MSLRVFSSPSGYTQAAQFSRNKQAENKSAQPQFAGGTDSYSFSHAQNTESRLHFGGEERNRDKFLRNLGEVADKGIIDYFGDKSTEKKDLRADLRDTERELDRTKSRLKAITQELGKLEGRLLFEPQTRVLTQNKRPVPSNSDDPSGNQVFVHFNCYQVQHGKVSLQPAQDFQLNRRTLIQKPKSLINEIDPSKNSEPFRLAPMYRHNPIFYWNEEG